MGNMGGRAIARTVGKLSAAAEKSAARLGYYSDDGGLYLQVSTTGAKSWVFRYKVSSKLYEMGLGPLPYRRASRSADQSASMPGTAARRARSARGVQGCTDASKARRGPGYGVPGMR